MSADICTYRAGAASERVGGWAKRFTVSLLFVLFNVEIRMRGHLRGGRATRWWCGSRVGCSPFSRRATGAGQGGGAVSAGRWLWSTLSSVKVVWGGSGSLLVERDGAGWVRQPAHLFIERALERCKVDEPPGVDRGLEAARHRRPADLSTPL